MNTFFNALVLARQDFFKLKRHRPAPAWAMWVMTLAVALAWGLGLLALVAAFGRSWPTSEWIERVALPFLGTALVIGIVFHVVYTAVERLAPDRFLAWVNGRPGFGVSLFYAASSMACVALGLGIAYVLLGQLPGVQTVDMRPNRSWLSVAAASVLVSVLWGLWALQQWHEEQQQRQAQEAQLKLLQAQIEPQFLFNTLANVTALIDADPARAKGMLEAFTDYLRASLGSLRSEHSTLADEMALVQAYLSLLQARMEDRLRFSLDVAPELARAPVPALLLQPLVENAVHHGLEPQLEGGQVTVQARREGAALVLAVTDNGQGLAAAAARRRKGSGLALQNLRQRLAALHGEAASLQLEDLNPGTRATLRLPLPQAWPAQAKAA